MRILKGAALGFFGFLLSLAVIIFMVANLINGTVLSPDFITNEIDKIEFGPRIVNYANEEFDDDDGFPPEVRDALFTAIIDTEPVIKEALNTGINSIGAYLRGETDDPALSEVLSDTFFNSQFLQSVLAEVEVATLASTAIEERIPDDYAPAILDAITENEERIKSQLAAASQPVFDYLLSQTDTIDLLGTLRETVLTTDFVVTLLDGLDIASISSSFLSDELVAGLSAEMQFVSGALDEAVAALEPTIKSAVAEAGDQLLDYLTGASTTVRVEVSMAPVLNNLDDILVPAFLESAPPEWDLLSQSEQDSFLDNTISKVRDLIPASFTIDETIIGRDLPDRVRDGVNEVESALSEVRSEIAMALDDVEVQIDEPIPGFPIEASPRDIIGWFLDGYLILIALIAVLALAIIAIHHEVKGASRQLGIIALICGIIGAGVAFAASKFGITFAMEQIGEIPAAFADLPEMLLNDLLGPLRTVGYGLVGGGLVLIAVSLIYPRLRSRDAADAALPYEEPEPPVEEPELPAEEPEQPTEEPEPPAEEPEPPTEEPEQSA